ncbi:hypothetical protein [Sorangium sp. So ce131]|uniref:hypothetical protein n=1 Tax=Sorangium sp. So ce131 TaxID=3133282 RepID=UPI003F636E01
MTDNCVLAAVEHEVKGRAIRASGTELVTPPLSPPRPRSQDLCASKEDVPTRQHFRE